MITFTIAPTYSGVGDQLTQFNAFYKLGLYLGYRYRHTPFISERSAGLDIKLGATNADIYEFIGLNRYFSDRSEQNDQGEALAINLSDETLAEWRTESLETLAACVHEFVQAAPSTALVRFQLNGERRNLFSMIQAAIPEFPDGLDLPGIYTDTRARTPCPSLHRNGALKLLVHVRQGDTAVLETPWHSFLPVWNIRADRFQEYDRFELIPATQRQFEISEYRQFLITLLERLDQSNASTLVFSDGATRAFKQVERNLDKLGWTAEQIQRFHDYQVDYDARQFAGFSEVDNVQLHVGEEPAKLCQLVQAALESDIVIVSNQQRMIPKLVANLGEMHSPKVIVLYKQEPPDNRDLIGNHDERFVYVDITKPDFDEVLRRLL